jgi:hypothetical protein
VISIGYLSDFFHFKGNMVLFTLTPPLIVAFWRPERPSARDQKLSLGRGVAVEQMILGRHANRPAAFPQKLSIMNLGVTREFLAGSQCSYQNNIKTIFLAGSSGNRAQA